MVGKSPKTLLQRYLPFLVVLTVQALLVAVLPSRGVATEPLAGLTTTFGPDTTGLPDGDVVPDGDIALPDDQGATGPTDGGTGRGTTDSGRASAPGLSTGAPRPDNSASTGAGGSGPADTAGGDTSHCTPDGRQQGVTSFSAPCVPRFVGDNGGTTYAGTSGDTIRAVLVRNTFGPVVDGALSAGGLAASPEEEESTMNDFSKFFNKHYESYGRTVEWSYYLAQCDMSTSVECARTQARKIKNQFDPFMVVTSLTVLPAYHDELSKLGVVNVGGWHQPRSFHERLRPFHYDWMPDGSRIATSVGDYWCKKMAGANAEHAGGPRLQTQKRKLGVVGADAEEAQTVVQELIAHIGANCPTTEIENYKYSAGFDKAGEEFGAIVTDMVRNGITTVVCMCDPIRPIFLTQAATSAAYFPEHLLSGMGAADHDYFGRLYDQSQWRNAFGPGIQPANTDASQQDDAKAYADVGAEYRCFACLANFIWMHLAHIMIQAAGPNLNPLTIEQGTLGLPTIGGFEQTGNPLVVLVRFGQGEYTAIADSMETYWDPGATSKIDGKPGAYVCVQPDCRRFEIGKRPAGKAKVPN